MSGEEVPEPPYLCSCLCGYVPQYVLLHSSLSPLLYNTGHVGISYAGTCGPPRPPAELLRLRSLIDVEPSLRRHVWEELLVGEYQRFSVP